MKWSPGSPEEWLGKLALYYRTARHLRPSQVVWWTLNALRSRAPVPRSLASAVDVHLAPPGSAGFRGALLSRLDRVESMACAERVMNGEFRFLNKAHAFERMPDWAIRNESRLWRFHLNYFDYAPALAAASVWTGEARYRDRLIELMRDWMRHATASADAWHPYPTSLRICNWIFALILLVGEGDLEVVRGIETELLSSLYAQARFLAKHLELDLRGNHLFENARALYVSSRAFSASEETPWAEKGRQLLLAQLSEQILPDGGHFENSPMYHCAVLGGVLDCLLFTSPTDRELHGRLVQVAKNMLAFLDRISYGDGSYPLLNDSATNMAISPIVLRNYAGVVLGEGVTCGTSEERSDRFSACLLKDSGYAVLVGGGNRLIADGGPIGPDYQPGHGHCDTLAYELRRHGVRIAVDSGVFDYENGDMRRYCRGTGAHNTVRVDGEEQSEIWRAFRVARRARPEGTVVRAGSGFATFAGRHTGYERLKGCVIHRRRIVLAKDAVVVHDELAGSGEHAVESFVHLAPELELEVLNGRGRVHGAPEPVTLVPYGPLALEGRTGWHCPEFGVRKKNDVLVLQGRVELPVSFGYVFVLGDGERGLPRFELEADCDGGILRLEGAGGIALHIAYIEVSASGGEAD